MKKLLALIIGVFIGNATQAMSARHEASMNFDLENVVPFLNELDSKYKLGLNVDELGKFASSIKIENEESMIVEISHSGKKAKMEFRVFMDDIDAPDLYFFFESSELADQVGDFMMEWAEARGM
jgi:hypothetical protein